MKRALASALCVALVLGLALSFGCSKPAQPAVNDTPPTPPAEKPAETPPPSQEAAPATTPPAVSGDVKKFTIDMEQSSIVWNAHVTGVGTREGGWSVFEGKVEVTGTDLSTAKADVTIDMKSAFADHPDITKKLVGDEHFFLPSKFPNATFKTTGIKASASGFDVSGDLTIRDKTKNITFPATIAIDGDNLTVKAQFEINRNDFDIKYQGAVGDYVIQDVCPVKLDIICVPAQ